MVVELTVPLYFIDGLFSFLTVNGFNPFFYVQFISSHSFFVLV